MLDDLEDCMNKSLGALYKKLDTIHTGRASVVMLDAVIVECYGTCMPLNQIASVSVNSATTLLISVWDSANVKVVEKAILKSNLGISPKVDGNNILLIVPQLNEERRQELVKLAYKYAEECKVALRNLRRIEMDKIKEAKKNHLLPEDEFVQDSKNIQSCTDNFIAKVDQAIKDKEQLLLRV